MAFKSFKEVKKVNALLGEPLLVWLSAPAATGKSTLTLDFFRTLCVNGSIGILIPMDHRPAIFEELFEKEGVPVYPVDPDPTKWNNEDAILKALRTNLPGSGANAVAWDSVTPRFREIIAEAQTVAELTPEERKALTGNSNKISAYQPKALFMEKVAAVATYGLNTIWISHEHEGKDKDAKDVMKTSITNTEIKKFRRNLNLHLRTGVEGGRYYVEIVWARDRQALAGKKLYDEQGLFKGMWNRIIAEFSDAPVVLWDQVKYWSSPDDAITAAMEQFVIGPNGEQILPFNEMNHAENAYNKLKKEVVLPLMTPAWKSKNAKNPHAAAELMATHWKAEVEKRLQARLLEATGEQLEPAEPPAEEPAEQQPEFTF
jgi:hypothetical protein